MSYNYGRDTKLVWFRHLMVPFLWLLLTGLFVFILINAPGAASAMAFMGLAAIGGVGTWFLMR